jgi:photosystem II stability/assembly factor-like uncharacterized protein
MPLELLNDAQSGVGYVGALERKGNVVWAVGGSWGSPLVMTSDGGRTYRRRKPPPANGLRDVLPLGDRRALVVGESGALFETRDGDTWTRLETGTTVCLFAIERAEGSIWISGEDGFLLASADGSAWRRPALGEKLKALGRIQRLIHAHGTLWLLGYAGRLAFLKNDRVELASVESSKPLTAIAFSPRGVGVVVGDGATVFRTTNRGKTWERVEVDVDVDLEDVAFHDGRFVAAGAEGTLLVSEDGAAFHRVETGRSEHLWCVASDGLGVLIGGDSGLVLRADDAALAAAEPVDDEDEDDESDVAPTSADTRGVDTALYFGDVILARIRGRVQRVADGASEPLEGVVAFGRSHDRKNVALAFADRIEIRGGLLRAAHATMPTPKTTFAEIHSIEVFPSGDRALVATSHGVFVVSERGVEPIHGGARAVPGAYAALSPDGRTIACGDRESAHLLFVADGPGFTLAAEVEPASPSRDVRFEDARVRLGALALDLAVLAPKPKKALKLSAHDAGVTSVDVTVEPLDTSDDGARTLTIVDGALAERSNPPLA